MADAPAILEVRRVKLSEDLAQPGDYVFIPKREPIVTYEKYPVLPPEGRWARLVWSLWGAKEATKEVIEKQWPDHDTAIVNCPTCNSPIGTTVHQVVSIEPLTLDRPLSCPYCKTVTFEVKDGKLTIA